MGRKERKGGKQNVRQSSAFDKDYSTKVNKYSNKEGVRNNRNRRTEGEIINQYRMNI